MKVLVFLIVMSVFLTFGNRMIELFRKGLPGLLYVLGVVAVIAFMFGVVPLVKRILWK